MQQRRVIKIAVEWQRSRHEVDQGGAWNSAISSSSESTTSMEALCGIAENFTRHAAVQAAE